MNPPDGAILDYRLKDAASGPVTLEILDAAGRLVRRFSSAEVPEPLAERELNVPTHWVRPPRALPAGAGFHRFVWDLHYSPPDALRHDYPIAAISRDTPRHPLGPWAPPGRYTVRLTAAGKTITQPLAVAMDPRVKTPLADLARQFDLATRIAAAMHRDFEALQQIRTLRRQLKPLLEGGENSPAAGAAAAIERKASALEGSGSGGFPPRRTGTEEADLSRSNGQLAALLEVVEETDAKPTSATVSAFADVEKALARELALWRGLTASDLPALNETLRKAGLPPIDLAAGAPAKR